MKSIVIPKVDANIEEGSLGAWMASPGDKIRKGQPLVEYITDKAVFEIEAPASGILRQITAPEKSVVPIGSVIGLIGRADEALPVAGTTDRPGRPPRSAPADRATDGDGGMPAAAGESRQRRPRATLGARRLARRHGVSLETIRDQIGAALITEAMVDRFINQ